MLALLPEPQTSTVDHSQRKSWPVEKLPTRAATVGDIQFADFKFQRFAMSRYGPSPSEVTGPPSKATKYFVEPGIDGVEAIVTAKFEAIDEHGATIAPIFILMEKKAYGAPYFFGMMLVPDRPFRVMVSGQAIDGSQYKRVYESLISPTSEPPPANAGFPLRGKAAEQKRVLTLLEDELQRQYLKCEQEFAKLPNGMIVLPRTRVSNVNYAVLFSPSNRPLGLRITYEMEFSQDGYYNPELMLHPDFADSELRGWVEMKIFNGSIKPEPAEESPQVRSHPLEHGASYNYRANTTYQFTAELYPDFVGRNAQGFCLNNRRVLEPIARAKRSTILASKEPVTYRVNIQNSDFQGIIEKFYSFNELYNNFVAEGAVDCEP